MKRITVSTFILFICLMALQAQNKVYTVENIPKVHLQDKTRYVNDPEQILSAEATATMDKLLYDLEQQTSIETAVVVVPSIGEADCFDFSHQLLNRWGVGKKGRDNGLVILLVTDQRCIQFYTGYGLEGDLPDAICKRIQAQEMIPYLKTGDWDSGMVAGIRAVCGRLDGTMVNDYGDNAEGPKFPNLLIAFLGLFGIFLLITFFISWRASKCPRCGKHKLQRTGSKVIARSQGIKTEEITYTCRNCGYVLTRQHKSYDDNYRGGGGMGPIIGGGLGGLGGGRGGFGGGFGGGSFGGGRGGGGGAGSRF